MRRRHLAAASTLHLKMKERSEHVVSGQALSSRCESRSHSPFIVLILTNMLRSHHRCLVDITFVEELFGELFSRLLASTSEFKSDTASRPTFYRKAIDLSSTG
ncbi:unnamed protein product [Somion occarium]|uniref:Uncharacterized protein n=1 Tax=Somion occarium TaxID=3059160 RepID=A0ABP1DZY2_9APHY